MKTQKDNAWALFCVLVFLGGGFLGFSFGVQYGVRLTFRDAEKVGLSYENQKTGYWAWKICDYCRE